MESSERMRRQGGRPVLLVSGRPLTEAQAARLIVAEARQLVQVSGRSYGIAGIFQTFPDLCEIRLFLTGNINSFIETLDL